MSKLYYDDPLQAAFMSREYGVEYTTREGTDLMKLGDGYLYAPTGEPYHVQEFYIHPNSYHIFEPQDGDKNIDGFTYDISRKEWLYPEYYNGRSDNLLYRYRVVHELPIDERNGTAFFIPKSEQE